MTAANPFIWEPEQYTRTMDFVNEGVEQSALFLSKMTGDPIEKTRDYIKANLGQQGRFPAKNPGVRYLERNKYGDRELKEGNIHQYLEMVKNRNSPMPPSMTAYLSIEEKPSILGEYIEGNVAIRSKFKKIQFEAGQRGAKDEADEAKGVQNSKKTFNNSLSGAHSSPGTPLYNRSGHSTLTSGCRITTAYGNANNEKFLAGNRHYWSPTVTIANILTIVRHTDYAAFQLAVNEYKIVLPQTEDVMLCIKHSSNPYWRSENSMDTIRRLIDSLTPLEKGAFLFIGDLYHFAKLNEHVVRPMLGKLIQVTQTPISMEEAEQWIGAASADMRVFINLLCAEWTTGKNIKDIKEKNPEHYCLIGANAKNVVETLEEYRVLIQGILRPSTLHGSIARLPAIIRRAVLASDTDSTIFTTQYWTEWFVGKLDFSIDSYRVGYTISYLTSQIVVHLLGMMSAQIGLSKKHLHRLEMKNEYYFPVFTLTSRAKHYFGCKSAQEGNVFTELKPEIKGVELRSSNAPKEINDRLHSLMDEIREKIMTKVELSLHDVLDPIYLIEYSIVDDLRKGGHRYLRTMPLKDGSAYVDGDQAPALFHHRLWQSVFAPKYGSAPELPYQGVKVNVALDNPTKFKQFIASIPDRALAQRLETYCEQNKRNRIAVFVFPKPLVEQMGVPEEVRPAIEHRKLIYSIMSPYYLMLESFNIYMVNPKQTRLVHDFWTPRLDQTPDITA